MSSSCTVHASTPAPAPADFGVRIARVRIGREFGSGTSSDRVRVRIGIYTALLSAPQVGGVEKHRGWYGDHTFACIASRSTWACRHGEQTTSMARSSSPEPFQAMGPGLTDPGSPGEHIWCLRALHRAPTYLKSSDIHGQCCPPTVDAPRLKAVARRRRRSRCTHCENAVPAGQTDHAQQACETRAAPAGRGWASVQLGHGPDLQQAFRELCRRTAQGERT